MTWSTRTSYTVPAGQVLQFDEVLQLLGVRVLGRVDVVD